jgi:ribosomal protein S3AE
MSKTYSSFFVMLDNSDTQFYLIKAPDTYGNNVVSLKNLKDNHKIITQFGEKKFMDVKSRQFTLKNLPYYFYVNVLRACFVSFFSKSFLSYIS